MRVGVDANISFRIRDALTALFSADDFETVGAGPAESDEPWISDFAAKGGEAIIGMDRQILQKPNEVRALHDSGMLSAFYSFPTGTKLHTQAAFIIWSWAGIKAIWGTTPDKRVLRIKYQSRLSLNTTSSLEYWIDRGRVKVRSTSIES